MTRLRLAAQHAVAAVSAAAALTVTIAGAPLVGAQPRYQQQPYQPGSSTQYGGYQAYQQPAYTPPLQPQATPYQASESTSTAYRVAEQQPLVQQPTQTAAAAYGSYQLPNYQAPAPGDRYAMLHDDHNGEVQPESVPAPEQPATGSYDPGYAGGGQTGSYNSNPSGSDNTAAVGSWEGYVQAPTGNYGCETGSCGSAYNHACDYGTFGGPSGHVLGERLLANRNVCRQWFFGAYALFMTRDNPSYERYAVLTDPAATYPYYPSQSETILSTNDVDPDWQWGAELRLGSTFGTPCGCEGGGLRPYAWEVVYWGLAEDENTAIVTDLWSDTDRMYGTTNYDGLEYDGGSGARDMPEYWDDIYDEEATDDVRVLGFRARSSFSAQNLELNFIRFPLAACNSCDPCGPPRFTVNGVCGLRYLKLDEDWQLASFHTLVDGGGTPNAGEPTTYPGGFPTNDPHSLFHDISVDNELMGFQFGSNMNWLIGCKWSAFCDTQVGIFGNRIDSFQRVWGGGTGEVYWDGTTNSVQVRSSKTDVSFLGEMRAGMGYQVACNCRLTLAYRVIAVTGVALAGEQIPNVWSSSDYVGIIDSNDSLVLHGIQWGAEWKF